MGMADGVIDSNISDEEKERLAKLPKYVLVVKKVLVNLDLRNFGILAL